MRKIFLFIGLMLFGVLNSFAQEFGTVPFVQPGDTFNNTQPELLKDKSRPDAIFGNVKAKPYKKEASVVKSGKQAGGIYLDFRNTDIREVARVLSKLSGVNMLVGEDVKADVTLNIEGVDWKTALDLICKTYNLAYIEKGDFIIIVSYDQIDKEKDKIPLVTKILTLNFVDIDDAKTYLKPVMTDRGVIESDERTNSLIITDIPESIEKAENILKELDRKTPQVLIEALMVDRKITDQFDLGIDWEFFNTTEPPYGSSTDITSAGTAGKSIAQTLSLDGQNIALKYGNMVFGKVYFDALIEALKKDTNTDILANPRILTLDNIEAEIQITDQVPYTEQTKNAEGNDITTTQFKDVNTILKVKPHITPDGHIIVDVSTEQSFVNYFTSDNQPVIATRKSENTMLIKDGETIVIGGLRTRERKKSLYKVPLLGDIPLLGKFFSKSLYSDETRELMIFITPRIVKGEGLNYKQKQDFIKARKDVISFKDRDILPFKLSP